MEILDIVDEHGQPTGETVPRSIAHTEGIRHRTSHVWLARRRGDQIEILVQKRCDEKDSFPGCYDISSAGHIPAGVDFKPSAIRELKEELGIDASEEELIYCGYRHISYDGEFRGEPFRDRQFTNTYVMWRDLEVSDFTLQAEEVSEVRWFELETLLEAVEKHTIRHCIYMEELLMVKQTLLGE